MKDEVKKCLIKWRTILEATKDALYGYNREELIFTLNSPLFESLENANIMENFPFDTFNDIDLLLLEARGADLSYFHFHSLPFCCSHKAHEELLRVHIDKYIDRELTVLDHILK